MNKILISVMMTASISLLTACGGGDSGSDNQGGSGMGTGTGIPVAGVTAFIPINSSGSNILEFGELSANVNYGVGSEGDIELTLGTNTGADGASFVFPQIQLANGIPSMNVVDIQITEAYEFSCLNGDNIRATRTTDYSTGVEANSGTLNGQSLTCMNTYEVVLPATISDAESIQSLLLDDELNTVELSSTCPNDLEGSDFTDDIFICDGSSVRNITVTDDNNVIHEMTLFTSVEN